MGLGLIDQGSAERIEVGVRRRNPRQGWPDNIQGEALGGALEPRGEAGGLGRRRQGLGDQRATHGIAGRGRRHHRKVQGELGRLRDTDRRADQVIYIQRQMRGLAQARARRNIEGYGHHNPAFVAIVHDWPERQSPGRRPDDLPRAPALGKGPGQAGRLAGVTGIAPIGVPSGVQILGHGDPHPAARAGAAGLGDQGSARMRAAGNLRAGAGRADEQADQHKKRRESFHEGLLYATGRPKVTLAPASGPRGLILPAARLPDVLWGRRAL